MNCKPNCLARIVAPGAPADGFVVTTKILHQAGHKNFHPSFGPVWDLDTMVPIRNRLYGPSGQIISTGVKDAFPDKFMRPLGNPSEDARDKTLEWLPVPSKEKEIA
jgi:hypothetical protein